MQIIGREILEFSISFKVGVSGLWPCAKTVSFLSKTVKGLRWYPIRHPKECALAHSLGIWPPQEPRHLNPRGENSLLIFTTSSTSRVTLQHLTPPHADPQAMRRELMESFWGQMISHSQETDNENGGFSVYGQGQPSSCPPERKRKQNKQTKRTNKNTPFAALRLRLKQTWVLTLNFWNLNASF